MASGKFQYRPLGDNQIRFISFQPVEAEAEAECDGQTVSLPDSTPLNCYLYRGPRDMQDLVALSYVWGPKKDIDQISLNGYEIDIQANLKAALTAIRKQRPAILLWVDALCINQGDDDEKSIEVGRMGDIYRNAKQAIAWLGPPENSSDDLIAKMTKAGSMIRSPFKPTVIPVAMRSAWSAMPEEQIMGYMMSREARQHGWREGTVEHYFIHFTISDDAEASLPESALKAFFRRPFWRRAWIIQEFSLPRDLYFQSGESCLSLEDFLEVRTLLTIRRDAAWWIPGYSDIDRGLEANYHSRLVEQVSTLIRIRDRVQLAKPMSVEYLLIKVFAKVNSGHEFEATDARDRVYGFLGLSTDCAIRPDYSKTCAEVYTQVAEQTLSNGNTDFLQYTTFPKMIPNLPSWVPDWSSTNNNMLRRVEWKGVHQTNDSPVYEVGSLNFVIGDRGIRQLRVTGVVLGKIAHILPSTDATNETEEHGLFKRFAAFTYNIEKACLHGCMQCNEGRHKPYKETIAKVICANWLTVNGEVMVPSLSQCRESYDICTKQISSQKANKISTAWPFMRCALRIALTRRPFVTSNGWLGVAPLHIEPKDLVCRLDGFQSPYILRKTDTGCYELLGECFIGANDEEAQEKKMASLAKVNFWIE